MRLSCGFVRFHQINGQVSPHAPPPWGRTAAAMSDIKVKDDDMQNIVTLPKSGDVNGEDGTVREAMPTATFIVSVCTHTPLSTS